MSPADGSEGSTLDGSLQLISCSAMATCAITCGVDLSCQTGCYERGTPYAQMLSQAIQACVAGVCVAADGGTARCTMYPGDFSAACQTCVSNTAIDPASGMSCQPAHDPACGHCVAEVQRCIADI
jgi:hypothetical protein